MPKDVRKLEVSTEKKRTEDVPCISCKTVTKHIMLASVDVNGEDFYGHNSVQYGSEHQIVQCRGCESITFRHTHWNSEDYDFGPDGPELNTVTNLYPSRSEGRNPINDSQLLPSDVQRIYHETLKAMNNDQPVLAGVGIRAIVESVCRDKKAKGDNLYAKIDNLISLGVLTKDGAQILHQVRSLGNKAAHDVKPHSTEQLALAVDVCEHLFLGVYVLPHHAKRTFKKPRSAKRPPRQRISRPPGTAPS